VKLLLGFKGLKHQSYYKLFHW